MNIYKYNVSQDKVITVTECEVIEEKPYGYLIKEGTRKNPIKTEELEVVSKRVLYSLSPDKKDFYVSELKADFARVIAKYRQQADDAEANLKTILTNSGLPLE